MFLPFAADPVAAPQAPSPTPAQQEGRFASDLKNAAGRQVAKKQSSSSDVGSEITNVPPTAGQALHAQTGPEQQNGPEQGTGMESGLVASTASAVSAGEQGATQMNALQQPTFQEIPQVQTQQLQAQLQTQTQQVQAQFQTQTVVRQQVGVVPSRQESAYSKMLDTLATPTEAQADLHNTFASASPAAPSSSSTAPFPPVTAVNPGPEQAHTALPNPQETISAPARPTANIDSTLIRLEELVLKQTADDARPAVLSVQPAPIAEEAPVQAASATLRNIADRPGSTRGDGPSQGLRAHMAADTPQTTPLNRNNASQAETDTASGGQGKQAQTTAGTIHLSTGNDNAATPETPTPFMVATPTQQSSAPGGGIESTTALFRLPSGIQVPDTTVVNQIIAHFTAGRRLETSTVHLRLYPRELGELRMEIKVEQDNIKAHFVAQNPQAREMIDRHLPRLREALEQQGLHLQQVEIAVATDDAMQDDRLHQGSAWKQPKHSDQGSRGAGHATFTLPPDPTSEETEISTGETVLNVMA